jgi:hypothetical protein
MRGIATSYAVHERRVKRDFLIFCGHAAGEKKKSPALPEGGAGLSCL